MAFRDARYRVKACLSYGVLLLSGHMYVVVV